jgi:hypothetical protein
MTGPNDNPYPPGSSTPTNQPSPAQDRGQDESRVAAAASRAGDEAAVVKDEAVGAAADVKDTAKAEVANVAGDARQEARTVLTEVRGQLDHQANDATNRLASSVAALADELRSMADGSQQPDSAVADAVRQVADRGAGLARNLESRGYSGIADDVARFGRNHAGAFLLAAGAAGFAIGRVLRNTDTGAVVQAAKGEHEGSDALSAPTLPATGAPVMPGSGERVAGEVVITETYEPIGSGMRSR